MHEGVYMLWVGYTRPCHVSLPFTPCFPFPCNPYLPLPSPLPLLSSPHTLHPPLPHFSLSLAFLFPLTAYSSPLTISPILPSFPLFPPLSISPPFVSPFRLPFYSLFHHPFRYLSPLPPAPFPFPSLFVSNM